MKTIILILVVALVLVQGRAATVWTGPSLTFTKPGGSDPTLPASQDRLNNDVWLTRGLPVLVVRLD